MAPKLRFRRLFSKSSGSSHLKFSMRCG